MCKKGNYGMGKKFMKEYYSFGDTEYFRVARMH